jgi:hypothetical protein
MESNGNLENAIKFIFSFMAYLEVLTLEKCDVIAWGIIACSIKWSSRLGVKSNLYRSMATIFCEGRNREFEFIRDTKLFGPKSKPLEK